ncbi:hypothetical protein HYV86_00920 [Candidatus Woesearchaeota archaeon]|nr:hypothetical protein [Candidatus Woesearchaeota archaeon]
MTLDSRLLSVVPHAVYVALPTFPREIDASLKGYVLLGRFQEPTPNEVVEYVANHVDEVLGNSEELYGRGELQERFPELLKEYIRDRNETVHDVMLRVAESIGCQDASVSRNYIEVRFGLLPNADTKTIRGTDPIKIEAYETLFENTELSLRDLGQQWNCVLLCTDRWELPDYTELETLIRHGVRASDTLTFSTYEAAEGLPQDEVSAALALLYQQGYPIHLIPQRQTETIHRYAIDLIGVMSHDAEEIIRQVERNTPTPKPRGWQPRLA